jgi:phospholipase C
VRANTSLRTFRFAVGAATVLLTTAGFLAGTGTSAHAVGLRPSRTVRTAPLIIRRVPATHPGLRRDPATAGPYATLLFSRTEMTAADNCVPDDTGIARLDTTVAPYLQSLGMTATGTLETGVIGASTEGCTHYGDSLMSSWSDAQDLATNYGWSFGSATATYPSPKKMAGLTQAQQYQQTCGSAEAINAHGLPGASGIIDYPGAQAPPAALQSSYGAQCFAWGRQYKPSGITSYTAGSTAPYWQDTMALKGGPCNDPSASCYSIAAQGSKRYSNPATMIAEIASLQPGQWLTIQSYLLVTGTSPAYASNKTQWDCTSANPADHWSNDVERYCYSDWQAIVAALAAQPGITVTSPLAVGEAFGRPSSYNLSPIKHVVVLYLENHSFDSLLGYWCDDSPGRCPDGGMPSSVTLSNGAVVTPSTAPDVVPNVRHHIADQVAAIDGGKMDGWQNVVHCGPPAYVCISGYQPSQIPNLSALAAHFAISDRFFSRADSPSWGGHLAVVTSTLNGFTGDDPSPAAGVSPGQGWGCDSNRVAPWAPSPGAATQMVPSCIPDPALTFNGLPLANGGAFEPTPVGYTPTIMDELNSAGLPWKLYTGSCPAEVTGANGLLTCTPTASAGGYDWAICPSIAECLYTQSSGMAPTGQVLTDAKAGTLPAFSVVTPGQSYAKDSEHNGFSITAGDNFLGQVANAIMAGPEAGSTALFITWDDCGCFYDQVPPPLNADGTQEGPRVPLVIASPWARPAYTDTNSASFDSILAFTEQNFGLPALGVNDAAAYNLSGAFNYAQMPLSAVRMVTRPVPKNDHIQWWQARQDS